MGAHDVEEPLSAALGQLGDGGVDRQQGRRGPRLGSEQVPLGEIGHRDNLAPL
jgi:hypothetical protein